MNSIRLLLSIDPPPPPQVKALWYRLPIVLGVTLLIGGLWQHWWPFALASLLLVALAIKPRAVVYFAWVVAYLINHLFHKLSLIPLTLIYWLLICPLGIYRSLRRADDGPWRLPSEPLAKDEFLRPY